MELIKKAMEKMSARERVIRTFQFESTDRVTIGYDTNEIAHQNLCKVMGLDEKNRLDFLKALGVDYIGVSAEYCGKPLFANREDRMVNPENGCVMRYVKNKFGGYWDYCDFPLKDVDDAVIFNHPIPDQDDYGYEEANRKIDHLLNEGFSIHLGHPGLGDILNTTGMLMGVEDCLVNMMTGHEATLHMIDQRLKSEIGVAERILEANKGKIDFMWLGEDLGSQHSPLISLDMYRKVLRPRHQRFVDLAKSYDIPVIIHTCGSSSWAYEDFIEMGICGVDTLQPEATNMSPQYLKDHFGGRLNFRGCISTAGPLASGTKEETELICKQTLEIMMQCKGYHFAPTHAIQDNTPPENTIAMYQAVHDYGCY